jgi:hypothetical protein
MNASRLKTSWCYRCHRERGQRAQTPGAAMLRREAMQHWLRQTAMNVGGIQWARATGKYDEFRRGTMGKGNRKMRFPKSTSIQGIVGGQGSWLIGSVAPAT